MPLLTLTFSSGESSLSIRRFSIEESLSSLFDLSIWARSPNPSIDLSTIVGHPATFRIATGYVHARNGGARYWTGIVSQASLVQAESTGLSTYFLRIVPQLWLLQHRRGHRIFQHQSIPEITDKLLAEWNIKPDWKANRSDYPPLEFKVQYGESDLDFLNRILEEAGIAYHFPDDDEKGSILTFVDEPQNAPPRAPPPLPFVDNPSQSAETEFVSNIRLAHAVRPGALTIRDYDFRNPAFPLFGEADKAPSPENRYEQFHYSPGGFLTDGHKPAQTPTADDRGVARRTQDFGDDRANRALVGARVGREAIAFETNTVDLWPGAIFNIDNHPHPEIGSYRGLLVTRFFLEGAPDDDWVMAGEAVFADVPYRPQLRTPKPKAYGVQSATVVGPSGQEIHTDEFGRVRVEFPWDRESTTDEKSSCWMRVNQGWGGQGYGFLVLPRIGQEVIIAFEHGDPDQPMIVGRAFNATNPVPYTLPDNKTISTWKSNSSTGGSGFNEIKFEDKKGDELFYVQAEKSLRKLVKNDETITVIHNRDKTVGINETDTTGVNRIEVTGVNRTETTGANRTTMIGGTRRKLVKRNETFRTEGNRQSLTGKNVDVVVRGERKDLVEDDASLYVKGQRVEKIDGHQYLTIIENQYEKVSENHALEAGKEIHLRSAELFIGEGAQSVTLKGPGGFVTMDSTGVTIKGTVVKINVGGSAGKGKGSKPKLPKEPKEATGKQEGGPAATDWLEDDAVGGGTGKWSVADVKKIIAKTNPEVIEKICTDKIKIISFDGATDTWRYDDGHVETQDLKGLRGNTQKKDKEIRIRSDMTPEQAATTLFHEMGHVSSTSTDYLQEEIDVRVKTEEFAIKQGLPETGKGYRTADGKVDRAVIEKEIQGSSHYNPKGKKRIGRKYEGENPTTGWCPP